MAEPEAGKDYPLDHVDPASEEVDAQMVTNVHPAEGATTPHLGQRTVAAFSYCRLYRSCSR
ncbi:hypothetical protein FZI85_28535 [Mycobacterium sp. CBMA293]|uniref:hypothetical protein n=1 Tax=unclassified Mycolicibacterium TaxID=2636767 RepID=UPI0012DDBCB9|nr:MULTISPECIES: hypothetical protein [unclassified Mycolicibacterium]MUL49867.1 hypothetical protein [Mycolicibacterium sp. CBMA 360]MUL61499.1 hypothetical protein [Mycolicibacterium sp. CBMA 335]MUL74234.1 hypothetical protein [Mycolicibacterium sp. CBMA 311]MUL97140.1 hypothetical protein [Mycolicibacterium sp. CBMA 230]MUM14948.1 hypothetical protein [Mycolicibacterium sp. CBMA 293]